MAGKKVCYPTLSGDELNKLDSSMERVGRKVQTAKENGMERKLQSESAGGSMKKFIEHSAGAYPKREPQRRALT